MRKHQSRSFRKHFAAYVCEGDSVEINMPGGFRAVARIVRDDCSDTPPERSDGFWPSQDPKAAGYIGTKSGRAFKRQMAKAKATLKAWENDEWFYCGVCVTIQKHGVQLTGDYDNALWGIECNYPFPGRFRPNAYLLAVANELLPEALEQAKAKLAQLAA